MTTTYPTASKLELAAICPGSHVLPQTQEDSTEAATRGIALHAFLATYAATPGDRAEARNKALAALPPEFREAAEAIDLSLLPPLDPESVLPEVALAYDLDTGEGRLLAVNGGRDYSAARPTEVVGTADVLGLTDDAVVVLDYKTGHGSQTAARWNWQLRFLALAAARHYQMRRAVVALVYVGTDLPPYFDRAVLEYADLAATELELSRVTEAVRQARWDVTRGQVPQMRTGEHCRYCPARPTCPALNAGLMAVAQDPASLATLEAKAKALPTLMRSLSDAELVGVMQRLKVLIPALEVAEREGKARVRERGQIRGADGTTLRAVEQARDEVNATLVEQVVTEMCGAEVAAKAVTYEATTTKKAIHAAVPADKLALVEEALRRAGAYRKGAPFVVVKAAKSRGGSGDGGSGAAGEAA